jgi:hypothetical protein
LYADNRRLNASSTPVWKLYLPGQLAVADDDLFVMPTGDMADRSGGSGTTVGAAGRRCAAVTRIAFSRRTNRVAWRAVKALHPVSP